MNTILKKNGVICFMLALALYLPGCTGKVEEPNKLHLERIRQSDNTFLSLYDLDRDGTEEIVLFEEEKFLRQDGQSSMINKVSFLSPDFISLYGEIPLDERGSINIRRDEKTGINFLGVTFIRGEEIVWKEYYQKGELNDELVISRVEDSNKNGIWEGHARLLTFFDANGDKEEDPVFLISAYHDARPRKIVAINRRDKNIIWELPFSNFIDIDNVRVIDHDGDGNKELLVSTCSLGSSTEMGEDQDSTSQLMVISRQGKILWSVPTGRKFTQCNLAIVEKKDDEKENKLVLLRRSYGGLVNDSNSIDIFNTLNGELLEEYKSPENLQKEFLICDLDNDGQKDIIVVTFEGEVKKFTYSLVDTGVNHFLDAGSRVVTMAAYDFYSGDEKEMKTGLEVMDKNNKEILILTSRGEIVVLSHQLKFLASYKLEGINIADVFSPEFYYVADKSDQGKVLLNAGSIFELKLESSVVPESSNLQIPIIIGSVFLVGILLFLLLQRSTELDHERLKTRQILASEKDRGLLILRNRLQVESINEAVFNYLKSDNLDFLWDESETKGELESKIKELLERLDQSSGVELSENGITAFLDSDNNQKIVDISTRKMIDHREEKHGYLVVIKDTWQKQWAKMAAENVNIGQELMHKIKTLISVYRNDIYMLKNMVESHEKEEELNEILDEMFSVSEDITEVTKVFLALSKTEASMLESTDLNSLLVETVKMLEHRVDNVTFEFDLDEDLPTTLMDREQMQSLILNLVENSQNALANGGNIIIKTELFRKMQESMETGLLDYLSFSVEDDGPGFNDDIAQNILEPGFSGFPGRVGLGLTISKRIVDHHNGELIIRSIEGKGTTVTVRLPYRG